MAKTFRRAKNLPTWRRIAVNAWAPPQEATIHGSLEIDATEMLRYIDLARAQGHRVTVTHLVAKALALAIAKMPQVNAIVAKGSLWLRDSVDVFLQVALDEGESLSGATIRNADKKSVPEIATELSERVSKIRAHTDEATEKTTSTMSKIPDRFLGPILRMLSWAQYDHGMDLTKLGVEKDTFGSAMVTNVGMFGLQQGFPPAFPLGRTAIVVLVGEVSPKAVVIDGEVVARPMLGLHATLDHRIVDGYHAGVLASEVRRALTDPQKHL
ncbi:MAG: 2-oxo acid dehydrogenase subunit E2 [Actinobacteria bacterium]|nr:2-oxo acid dehydrogenase subunit E2 [Actinomycetota bacterium]